METNKKTNKKKFLRILLILVVLSIVGYIINKVMYNSKHEDTDDAQLEANISPVISRVSGYVTSIKFEENQKVSKGQVLVQLDTIDLKIKEKQAEAALENAIGGLNVIKANTGSASANVATAKASVQNAKIRVWKATEDFTRYQKLLAQNAITQQQFDIAKAEKEAAEAQLDITNKQLDASVKQTTAAIEQIRVAESVVAQKKAELDFAKLQLSYSSIVAPSSGIASKKNVQIGQFIQAGQPLFSVVADSDIWVVANFKETQLEKMNIGQEVEVEVDAYKSQHIQGKIASFSGATGAKFSLLPPDNATGNFVKVVQRIPVRIKLNVEKSVAEKLRPGMSVKVIVTTAS